MTPAIWPLLLWALSIVNSVLAIDKHLSFVLGQEDGVTVINPTFPSSRVFIKHPLPVRSVDVDHDYGLIYWADGNIFRAWLDGQGVVQKIKTPDTVHADDIFFDWISRNIYYADRASNTIGVCRLERYDSSCADLVHPVGRVGLEFAVDPNRGLLYLFNEPKPGSITTMDMATSKMTLMVDFTTGPLKYIGLHDSTSSLFFADGSGNNIYSAHPESNPNNTDIVLQLDEKSRADITTGDIWYTLFCWSRSSSPFEIECKSRGDKTDKRDVYNNTARVTSLKIARPSGKQQLVTNHCQEKPCSHVCVLSSFSYRCLCPTGLVLQADQKTCK